MERWDPDARRTYAIVGTGAVGGYYGALLQRAGHAVHFLLRSDVEHVRRHGLVVESKNGDFALPHVNAYSRPAEMPACDVVVVALKTTQNALLGQLLPPLLKDDGVVLTLQNGLGPEEEAAAVVGPGRVLGGLCFLCSNKVGPGHIRHLDYGKITLGEYVADPTAPPAGITPRLRAVAGDLYRAGVEVEPAEDLLAARWRKLVWNVPFNGLSVLLDATTDELVRDPHSLAVVERLMQEVAGGSAAFGRPIPEEFLRRMLAMTRAMAPYRTSMKIDYDERRPMEVEAIFGSPVRAARQAGFDPVLMAGLYQGLSFLDARRRRPIPTSE